MAAKVVSVQGRGSRYGSLTSEGAAPNLKRQPSRPGKLEKQPTFARLQVEKLRASHQSMPIFLDMEEPADEAFAGVTQSARAARRSWSISGGYRDPSFKKRDLSFKKTPGGDTFAAVLSLSGWDEIEAEEVDLGVQTVAGPKPGAHEPTPASGLEQPAPGKQSSPRRPFVAIKLRITPAAAVPGVLVVSPLSPAGGGPSPRRPEPQPWWPGGCCGNWRALPPAARRPPELSAFGTPILGRLLHYYSSPSGKVRAWSRQPAEAS